MNGYKTYAGIVVAVVGLVLIYLGQIETGMSVVMFGLGLAGYGRYHASQRSNSGERV